MLFIFYSLFAIVASLFALYVYGTRNFDYFEKLNFPCTGNLMPFFGSMGNFVASRTSFDGLVREIYDRYKDYKLVGMFEFKNPTVMIRDPELIKEVTVKAFDHFPDKKNHRFVPFTKEVEPLLCKTLPGLEGEAWKDMRSTLSPAFTASKMKGMFDFVTICGEQLCQYLETLMQGGEDGSIDVEMKDLFTRYSNDVISTSAFGIHCDSLRDPNNEVYMAARKLTTFSGLQTLVFFGFRISAKTMKFLGFNLLPKKALTFLKSLLYDTLDTREKNGIIRPDLIHLMMESRKQVKYDDNGEKMRYSSKLSDEDIVAQSLFFYLAGLDTSSSTLSWLTYLIAVHPDVQRRLREEIDATLAESDGQMTYENITEMKYLDMCIHEALRLWPPIAITNRECVKNYTFPATKNTPSLTMKKGVGVWIPVVALHRDPEYFPDPDRFDPERFSDAGRTNIVPFTYMPFGNGPRNCIGRRFALMSMKIAVVSLLAKFELHKCNKTNSHMQKKNYSSVVEGGFWVQLKVKTPKKTS